MLIPKVNITVNSEPTTFPSLEYVRQLGYCGPVCFNLQIEDEGEGREEGEREEMSGTGSLPGFPWMNTLKRYFTEVDAIVGGFSIETEKQLALIASVLNEGALFVILKVSWKGLSSHRAS